MAAQTIRPLERVIFRVSLPSNSPIDHTVEVSGPTFPEAPVTAIRRAQRRAHSPPGPKAFSRNGPSSPATALAACCADSPGVVT